MDHRQKKERGISLLGFLITFFGDLYTSVLPDPALKRWEELRLPGRV
ncbi:MAG: hypothetical protein U0V70_00440 [Terriglobia bacterium]